MANIWPIARANMGRHAKRRVPSLLFTNTRGIGWHVDYRDPQNGTPRRFRFGMIDRATASDRYNGWLAEHLRGAPHRGSESPSSLPVSEPRPSNVQVQSGSLLHVASSYLFFEEKRTRKPGERRRAGTIGSNVLSDRRHDVQEFLKFINKRCGPGSAGTVSVIDLKMVDVEAYNAELVKAGYSEVLVNNRLQAVKAIVDRAGRPENGEQVLTWNWNARDKLRGKASSPRVLPSLPQLKTVLEACDVRTRALVWMGIGLGFGQGDLAAVRVGQIDTDSYDLRRGKTGLNRYGETPHGVWKAISEYLKEHPRQLGDLLFVTRKDQPLLHDNTDSVHSWWQRLRISMGKLGKSLEGFYVLRHLGATEFGSRQGCSIGDMRRWLGHAASSSVADVYMRPVGPEHREVVEWVRKYLLLP
jgi:integrase